MRVKCAQQLWSVVRHWDRPTTPAEVQPGARLGGWAATRFKEDGDDLVIAIHTYTYLTVVCPLKGAEETSIALKRAIADVLHDLGLPARQIDREIAALGGVHFEWLRDPSLRSGLREAAWYCSLERTYDAPLRAVQNRLNEAPRQALGGNSPECAALAAFRGTGENRIGPH